MNQKEYVQSIGFKKIGFYSNDINNPVTSLVKKTERADLVYCLFVANEIKYIGKTVQGYTRPLNYHKNDVMKNVRNGIQESLISNDEVEVWAKKFNADDFIEWKGLKLNIIEPVEQALILKFTPLWNVYKHKS